MYDRADAPVAHPVYLCHVRGARRAPATPSPGGPTITSTLETTAKNAAATMAGTKAATTAADVTRSTWDTVSDVVDRVTGTEPEPEPTGTPTWATIAAGLAVVTGVLLAIRWWRRRNDERMHRFETLADEDEAGYTSSAETVAGWDLPEDVLSEPTNG